MVYILSFLIADKIASFNEIDLTDLAKDYGTDGEDEQRFKERVNWFVLTDIKTEICCIY